MEISPLEFLMGIGMAVLGFFQYRQYVGKKKADVEARDAEGKLADKQRQLDETRTELETSKGINMLIDTLNTTMKNFMESMSTDRKQFVEAINRQSKAITDATNRNNTDRTAIADVVNQLAQQVTNSQSLLSEVVTLAVNRMSARAKASEDYIGGVISVSRDGSFMPMLIRYKVDERQQLESMYVEPSLAKILRMDEIDMKEFSPVKLVGKLYTLDGRMIPYDKMPSVRAVKNGEVFYEIVYYKKNGDELLEYIFISAEPVRQEGKIIGVTTTFTQVTALIKLVKTSAEREMLSQPATPLSLTPTVN